MVEAEPAQAEATQAEATQAEATQAEATQAEATQAIGDDPAARQRLIAEAVALCHAACAACAREDAPRAWAGAHLQLAVALIAQASLMESVTARRPALDEAVAASRAALTVFTRGTYPANWGETQTCLGEALAARTAISEEGERAAMIRAAAEAWQAALEVFTAQEAPYQHERVLTVLSRLTA
jgi:hypothetical protein